MPPEPEGLLETPPLPTLTTDRLLLRPMEEDDREAFIRMQQVSEEHFRPWVPVRKGGPEAHFEEELERGHLGWQKGTHARWIGVLADGRIAGTFGLNEIVRRAFQSAYAGWGVSADAVGRGIATEGVAGMLDLAFSPAGLGLHRVQANIIPENAASLRVAEKVGMRREGRAERYLQIAGAWRDHVMFAKTAEEHAFVYLGAHEG